MHERKKRREEKENNKERDKEMKSERSTNSKNTRGRVKKKFRKRAFDFFRSTHTKIIYENTVQKKAITISHKVFKFEKGLLTFGEAHTRKTYMKTLYKKSHYEFT